MGNVNCCCRGGCCCPEESLPVRSRSSSSNPEYYGRRIRLWPPNSGDPEQEPSEDSKKVIMEIVPCDYSEEEDQRVDEVDSTAHKNRASVTSIDSLPQRRTNEEDPTKAEGDAWRCGNDENGLSSTHVIDLHAWNTKRYDSTSEEEEDLADHIISVMAQVHAEFSSSDTEDVEIAMASEKVDAIALENQAGLDSSLLEEKRDEDVLNSCRDTRKNSEHLILSLEAAMSMWCGVWLYEWWSGGVYKCVCVELFPMKL
ncbi:uncharacterized protein [Dipodomys merriami]|uniref:uncharacterized protein n=1 Tax=Dipodomys merriami TaxID=94247 RepID=UPI00385604E1